MKSVISVKMLVMQFKEWFHQIHTAVLFSLICHSATGKKRMMCDLYLFCIIIVPEKVSLSVEGGVSLVGPHCPGTVRLFCEGVDLYFFGWTYNAGIHISDRFQHYDQVTSFSDTPTNPAFVSVNITDVSLNINTRVANFSSILVVDLLELSKQKIHNITCGDLSDTDTQQVDITLKHDEYFTSHVTAIYQLGILNSIKVDWIMLVNQ